jgi:hypothetical protein
MEALVMLRPPMLIDFHGVKPPELDVPLIDFETDDGAVVDLYNDYRLRGATFEAGGLTFEFTTADKADVRPLPRHRAAEGRTAARLGAC